MRRTAVLIATHGVAIAVGFAVGVYFLPILTAPQTPSGAEFAAVKDETLYAGEFRRDLPGSDFLHWGEGKVFVGRRTVALEGRLAPGPDYKLYLSPEYVDTGPDFERLKDRMARVGDVKTFENFIVPVPDSINPADYNAVIVWCESFSKFITAARYRSNPK